MRIFLNYRREDTEGHAGRLRDGLVVPFGNDSVFMDVVGIDPGEDFVEEINRQVAACDVLIAIIGRQWLSATDRRGRRRLDDPQDFVRLEIEAAIDRGIRVIPVLVQGAEMPAADELPESLAPLARRHAMAMTPAGWADELKRLVQVIERTRQPPPPAAPAPGALPAPPTTSPARPRSRRTRDVVEQIETGEFVNHIAFTPDGERLVTAGSVVEVWDVESGERLGSNSFDESLIYALAVSPDGRYVATGHNRGRAHVWDAATAEPVVSVKRGQRVYGVAFSDDGEVLATGLDNRSVVTWTVPQGNQHLRLTNEGLGIVEAVAFNSSEPDARHVVAATRETLMAWTFPDGHSLSEFGYESCYRARLSGDGRRLATLALGDTMALYDVNTFELERRIKGVAFGPAVAFGADGKQFAVAWLAGGASVFGARGKEKKLNEGRRSYDVALNPSGSLLATADDDGVVRFWRL